MTLHFYLSSYVRHRVYTPCDTKVWSRVSVHFRQFWNKCWYLPGGFQDLSLHGFFHRGCIPNPIDWFLKSPNHRLNVVRYRTTTEHVLPKTWVTNEALSAQYTQKQYNNSIRKVNSFSYTWHAILNESPTATARSKKYAHGFFVCCNGQVTIGVSPCLWGTPFTNMIWV